VTVAVITPDEPTGVEVNTGAGSEPATQVVVAVAVLSDNVMVIGSLAGVIVPRLTLFLIPIMR